MAKSVSQSDKGQAAIEKLPNELEDKILSYFTLRERLETLSPVCRAFRQYNRYHSYHSVHVLICNPQQGGITKKDLGPLFSFSEFCTIMQDRDFSIYVKFLTLEFDRWELYDHLKSHLQGLSSLKNLRILTLNPPPYQWDIDMQNPQSECKTMRLNYYYDRARHWQAWEDPSPPLLNLAQYLRISQLRTLQIEHISFGMHKKGLFHFAARGTSLIEDLRFFDCSPQAIGVLPDILDSIKTLKRLTLEFNCPHEATTWRDAAPHTIDPYDLFLALQKHSNTLEELNIAFSNGADYIKDSNWWFSDFPELKTLAIPERFLANHNDYNYVQQLPPNLRQLQLQYQMYHEHLVPDVYIQRLHQLAGSILPTQERVEVMPGLFDPQMRPFLPRLKEVVCWYQNHAIHGIDWNDLYGTDDEMQDITELFQLSKIDFRIHAYSFFKCTPFCQQFDLRYDPDRARPSPLKGLRKDGKPGLYYDEGTHSVF